MDSTLSHEQIERFEAIEARLDKLDGGDNEDETTEEEDDEETVEEDTEGERTGGFA